MSKQYIDVLKEMAIPQVNVSRDFSSTLSEEQRQYIQEFDRLIEKDYNNMDTIVEQLLQEFKLGNMDKVKNAFDKNMVVAKKFLYDHGITTSHINAYKDKGVKIIKNGYKSKQTPKAVTNDLLDKVVTTAIKKIVKGAKFTEEETKDPSVLEKIVKSLAIIVAIMLIQGIVSVIIGGSLLAMVGPVVTAQIAPYILVVVLAPIIEEYAKRLAIQQKYPWVFTGVFNAIEGLGYVMGLIKAGASIPAAIILRLSSAMMHFATTYIQKLLRDKVEAGELDEKWDMMGFYIAVGVHAAWNIVAMVYNDKIGGLMGIKI